MGGGKGRPPGGGKGRPPGGIPGSGRPLGGNGGMGIPRPPGATFINPDNDKKVADATYEVSFLGAYQAYQAYQANRMVAVGYLQGSQTEAAS